MKKRGELECEKKFIDFVQLFQSIYEYTKKIYMLTCHRQKKHTSTAKFPTIYANKLTNEGGENYSCWCLNNKQCRYESIFECVRESL